MVNGPGWDGRAAVLTAGLAALVTGVGTGAAAAAADLGSHAGAHAAPVPGAKAKYYMVPPPADGHREFLYQIAAQVLGDPDRYPQIVRLNEGRLQPGGARLRTPASIDPGWILILPPYAAGPGVRFGVPPAGPAGTAARLAPGPASRPAAAGAASSPAGPGRTDAIRVTMLAVIVMLLIAVAWNVSRRQPATDGQPAADPPAGGVTPPAGAAAPSVAFRPGLLPPPPSAVPPRPSAGHIPPPAGGTPPPAVDRRAPAPPPGAVSADDLPWPDFLARSVPIRRAAS